MTPEIEESKRRLYALASPRIRAALDAGFRLLARPFPPPDEPEVREARQNREANRLFDEFLSKRPGKGATPLDGKEEAVFKPKWIFGIAGINNPMPPRNHFSGGWGGSSTTFIVWKTAC